MMTIPALYEQHLRVQFEQDRLAACVAEARRDGLTWDEIGQALGVTKQAVQQRFGQVFGVAQP